MKDALDIILGIKDESYLSEYIKKVVVTLKDEQTKRNFERWLTLLNVIVYQGKKYYVKYDNSQNLNNTKDNSDEIKAALNEINEGFKNNIILKGFYETGENKDLIFDEINKIYAKNVKIEESSIGIEKGKTYVKATSHKTGTETGFASPFLLALLTATIEISTVAYIIFNAMD